MRLPTEDQRATLRVLAGGSMIVSGGDRQLRAMVKRGWIAPDKPDGDNGFRITADGLRALAATVDQDGLPEITGLLARPRVRVYQDALRSIRSRGCHWCSEEADKALTAKVKARSR